MPVTEAQKRATAKYEKENYDKVLVRFPKGTKKRIMETGAASVNGYIIDAVSEKLDKDGTGKDKPEKELDFSAYDKKKAEAENIQTMEELQEHVLMRQAEEAKQRAEKPKDPPPDDDALTKKLNEIRDRRKQAQEGNS